MCSLYLFIANIIFQLGSDTSFIHIYHFCNLQSSLANIQSYTLYLVYVKNKDSLNCSSVYNYLWLNKWQNTEDIKILVWKKNTSVWFMFSSAFPTCIDFNCFSYPLYASLTTLYLCCVQVTDIWRKTKHTGYSSDSSESSHWLQEGDKNFPAASLSLLLQLHN